MKAPAPYLDNAYVDSMRQIFDDAVLSSLLDEFVRLLDVTLAELDTVPYEQVEEVRFLAVKLRGSASEFGALHLTSIVRGMETSLDGGATNVVDWRLLLREEIRRTRKEYLCKANELMTSPAMDAAELHQAAC